MTAQQWITRLDFLVAARETIGPEAYHERVCRAWMDIDDAGQLDAVVDALSQRGQA